MTCIPVETRDSRLGIRSDRKGPHLPFAPVYQSYADESRVSSLESRLALGRL
jgi:hypothetical protein